MKGDCQQQMHRKPSISKWRRQCETDSLDYFKYSKAIEIDTRCDLNQNHNNNICTEEKHKVMKNITKSYFCAICDWCARERLSMHVCKHIFKCISIGNVMCLRLKSHGMAKPSNKSKSKKL